MSLLMRYLYKAINKGYYLAGSFFSFVYLFVALRAHNVSAGPKTRIKGFPRFIVKGNGKLTIGSHFSMNSGKLHNPIGRNQRCILSVADHAVLSIGDHVGMSSVAIICQQSITIGDHVKIGGNTLIYDTDFHSLDASERSREQEDQERVKKKPVTIGDHVFIGGHSIILKGTVIGDYAVIGAGSVVSGSIPANQVWAGNPARFIRNIATNSSLKDTHTA